MRTAVLAALLSVAGPLGAGPAGLIAPGNGGTGCWLLEAQEAPRPPAPVADTLPGPAPAPQPADTAGALPDTTLEKIRARTPIFPADVDPYLPVGLGRPELVLERDDLNGWPGATLADILPRLIPLAIEDQGGPGFLQAVRFPSGPLSATRLLIDGRPLESPLDVAADLRALPLTAVERIEVHPGASAVPGGAEAGWIHVLTRTHLTPQANSGLFFELGSFGQEGFGGWLSRWLGSRLSVFGSLHFDDTETFTEAANADRSRFWGKLRWYVSRRHFVEAAYGTSGVTTETRRAEPVPPSPFTGTEDRLERRFQALYRGRIGPALASLRFFQDRFDEREGFTLAAEPQLTGEFTRRGVRATVRLGSRARALEAGAEWSDEEADSDAPAFIGAAPDPPAGDSLAPGSGVSRTALLAGGELALDSLSLAAHARLERFEGEGEVASEPSVTAEARYAAPGGFTPFVRAARAVRHPSLVEQALLVRSGGSDAVRLATARELRAGASWRSGGLSAEVAAFDRRSSDAILWLPPTGSRAVNGSEVVRIEGEPGAGEDEGEPAGGLADLNLLDLQARGLRLHLGVPLPLRLRAEAAAQLQSVETGDGERVPYLADEHALGRLVFEERFFPSRNLRVRAAVDGRLTGARTTRQAEELPAYVLVDALLRVQLIGFTLGLSAENVFDRRYRTEEAFLLPGRVVAFEVFWDFWN